MAIRSIQSSKLTQISMAVSAARTQSIHTKSFGGHRLACSAFIRRARNTLPPRHADNNVNAAIQSPSLSLTSNPANCLARSVPVHNFRGHTILCHVNITGKHKCNARLVHRLSRPTRCQLQIHAHHWAMPHDRCIPPTYQATFSNITTKDMDMKSSCLGIPDSRAKCQHSGNLRNHIRHSADVDIAVVIKLARRANTASHATRRSVVLHHKRKSHCSRTILSAQSIT